MRKFFSIILLLFTISACNTKDKSTPEPGVPDAKALRVAILPISACQPFVEAYSRGALDSMHADIALVHCRSFSECRYVLTHGNADCAVIDLSLLNIMNRGLPAEQSFRYEPLKYAKPLFRFLTSKKARLRHISQMTDKIIACDSHGATHDIAYSATDTLRRCNHNIFLIQCEDLSVRTQMLITGNVDAALLPEPYATRALNDGCTEIPLPKIQQSPLVLAFTPKADRQKIDKLRKTIKIF